MRSVIIVLLVLIGACYGSWLNRTTSSFVSTAQTNIVKFEFDIEQVPVPGSSYYAEIELDFAEMFDELTLTFEDQTTSFIAKEKGQKYVVVLSTIATGDVSGWSSNSIRCGTIRATLTCASKIRSATLRMNVMNTITPSCHRKHENEHNHNYETQEEDSEAHLGGIVVIAILAFASVFCLCCTIGCVRRCAARRCCKKNYKPVEEAYPAEAIVQTETADQFVGQDTQQQQQYVFPYPVMAVPITGDGSQQQQYVQLMPVMYAQQQ